MNHAPGDGNAPPPGAIYSEREENMEQIKLTQFHKADMLTNEGSWLACCALNAIADALRARNWEVTDEELKSFFAALYIDDNANIKTIRDFVKMDEGAKA